ncbi:MAG TPA: hypothetical protein VHZ02_08235 [Acidimicrobiales bacterium]|nr:hypothetical protein [Acidimicrobiales bacterium]
MTEQGQPIPHRHYVAELPDLAIGVLDGRERAVVLDHVADCASCTAELEQLTAVVDSLVHLAAEVEPPVGFETRVLSRLQVPAAVPDTPAVSAVPPVSAAPTVSAVSPVSAAPTVPATASTASISPIPRGWRRSLLVSAAAAVVALAFGIGWVVHSAGRSPVVTATGSPKGYVAEAALVAPGGQPAGTVSVYPGYAGYPSWLFMTVSSPHWTGRARCAITSTDGTTHVIGSFTIAAGHQASWGAPLPVAATSVHKAELIAPDGRILASANLT